MSVLTKLLDSPRACEEYELGALILATCFRLEGKRGASQVLEQNLQYEISPFLF